jgi:toxin ParE1/3/4
MSRFRVSSLAQSDLDRAWLHVAKEASVETVDHLIDEIVRRVMLLSKQPEAGRLREDIAPLIRSFVVGNYIIYYRPNTPAVVIARVLHGSRDQRSAFEEQP